MNCEMTLDEVIRILAPGGRTYVGDNFVEGVVAHAESILRTPSAYSFRQVAAAGILDGYRRGNEKHITRELRRYWDRKLKPKPEPEWVEVVRGSATVRHGAIWPEGDHNVRVMFTRDDAASAHFRVRCRGDRLIIEQHREVPSDDS